MAAFGQVFWESKRLQLAASAGRRPHELEFNAGSVATKLFMQPNLDK